MIKLHVAIDLVRYALFVSTYMIYFCFHFFWFYLRGECQQSNDKWWWMTWRIRARPSPYQSKDLYAHDWLDCNDFETFGFTHRYLSELLSHSATSFSKLNKQSIEVFRLWSRNYGSETIQLWVPANLDTFLLSFSIDIDESFAEKVCGVWPEFRKFNNKTFVSTISKPISDLTRTRICPKIAFFNAMRPPPAGTIRTTQPRENAP